jgi:hypothetical protein
VVRSRLNQLRALPEHAAEPAIQTAVNRYVTHVGAAIERLPPLSNIQPASQVRAGRVVSYDTYYDQFALLTQLGLSGDSEPN